jgi:hypothetical protein
MDAMFTLWSTKEEDGQEKYGENFHNSTYFTSAHDFNAAWQDADHIHEGLGFIPQHIKITNMFELSMQAVNPSISLPFWDFTIDNSENITIFESFMFTNETFGTLPSPKDHKWGWTYSAYDVYVERKVAAVSGNTITLDAPIVDHIDTAYATAELMR